MKDIPEDLRAELYGGWKDRLLVTATKQPRPLLANALTALRDAPEWEAVLAYDEFALATVAKKPPPWQRHESNSWQERRWTDHDSALATDWLQHHGIGVPINVAAQAIEAAARDISYHPIRDYLNDLIWDGTKRVEEFAARYLGAERVPYHKAVSRCMFIAAVARVMQPGCKADYMPILEGPQDLGKSRAVETLFAPWFSDDLAELGTKDAALQVRCAWGLEVAELSSMTRPEIERIKAFITRRVDRFRPPYGRSVIEVPRQSILVGTTNSEAYLKDETGGRRFFPIRCGQIALDGIGYDRDQLWAEAKHLYDSGASWWLTSAQEVDAAREQQADRYVGDPWDSVIAEYIGLKADISVGEILSNALFVDKARWTQTDQNRVVRYLVANGWSGYWARSPTKGKRYRLSKVE